MSLKKYLKYIKQLKGLNKELIAMSGNSEILDEMLSIIRLLETNFLFEQMVEEGGFDEVI